MGPADEASTGSPARRRPPIVGLAVALPAELDEILMQSPIALAAFATLPASQQRSYVAEVARGGDHEARARAAAAVVDDVLENKQQP